MFCVISGTPSCWLVVDFSSNCSMVFEFLSKLHRIVVVFLSNFWRIVQLLSNYVEVLSNFCQIVYLFSNWYRIMSYCCRIILELSNRYRNFDKILSTWCQIVSIIAQATITCRNQEGWTEVCLILPQTLR